MPIISGTRLIPSTRTTRLGKCNYLTLSILCSKEFTCLFDYKLWPSELCEQKDKEALENYFYCCLGRPQPK